MALPQQHVSKRMLPGLLSVILALAAAAGSSATDPPPFVCPKINASLCCACAERRADCSGLRASDLGFLAPSAATIESLLASHNDLSALPADALPGAANLQELTLSYNKIASIDGRFFESLPSLQILDLSHNKLVEFYLPQNGLPNLEILNLTNNSLSYLRFDADRRENHYPKTIKRNSMICGTGYFIGGGLEQLYLSHNKIGNDLAFLGNLTKLKALTLGFNNISVIDPNLLPGDAWMLRCLHVNDNFLSDLSFLKCTEYLDKLNVSSNVISAIPEDTFKNVSILRILDLSDNRIENATFLHNVSPITIEFLNISRNKLSTIPGKNMMNMSKLESVDISYNELTDISFAAYPRNLALLVADNNKISQIDKSVFLQFRRNEIKTLSLSSNLLSNIDFLKSLPNITNLDLNNNTINQINEDTTSQLKKLEKLDLSNNRISNVNFVNKMPFLRLLKLSNNSVTQLPCNDFVQTIYLDGNNIKLLELSCTPSLRYLYAHGGVFTDRKEQELRISKEVLLDVKYKAFIFPRFPSIEDILKCQEQCNQTEKYEIWCDSHEAVFTNPITIIIYCISALLCSLVIFLIVAKCYRLRTRNIDNNRECLCGDGERVRRHHSFRSNELCW